MSKNATIVALNNVGQSIWYDNLSRDVLRSGELATLINSGVSGLTSNPTIFKKAIADTADYDTDIQTLAQRGISADDLCEELMIRDVAAAADLLRPIYDSTKGADGYASIEVSPSLARDAKNTVAAAKRIWAKLNRPNIMIKIPATAECIPAIKETLSLGINVNITLIFSVEVYAEVAEAYLSALESRLAKKEQISSIASVASFFVSRVDAICDKSFDALVKAGKAQESDRAKFFGKVGIANSKLAYEHYEKEFKGARFANLAKNGARAQRPLWASTGTKNPSLGPVLYVEALAGKDTVNTVPPATLAALMKGAHAEPRLHNGLADAKAIVATLAPLGLNFPQLLKDLQTEGVKLFADSYKELIQSIETKRSNIAQVSA